jgi:hypothetical protein
MTGQLKAQEEYVSKELFAQFLTRIFEHEV